MAPRVTPAPFSGFHYFNNFAALVFSAMRARAVRPDLLVAIGALGHLGYGQRIVGAPVGCAALGVPPFWIWHFL